jgi:hypothetical protein
MGFINNIPPLVRALIGFLSGAFAMRLLSFKDKTLLHQCVGYAEQSEAHLSQLMRFVP